MKIIGLDVGEKRIGVAKGDTTVKIATPIGFIEVNGTEWQEIAKIARTNSTSYFVIGLPRSNEGNETKQSLYVRNFAKKLISAIPEAKIRFQDESLTSVVAEERLKSRKKPYQKGDIDAEAATLILQDYLESIANDVGTFNQSIDNTLPSNKSTKPKQNPVEAKAMRELQNVKERAKKQSDKVLLNTKKVKHKMKTSTKWISGIAIFTIVALITVGGLKLINKIREDRARERAEEYARQEAEMKAEVFNFMIKPGETIFDIKKSLLEVGYSEQEIDDALNAEYDFEMLQDRPENATLEGFFYGDTHEFYETATVQDIFKAFLQGMQNVINENDLTSKYADRGLSLFQGITLASVVQKEASPKDQSTVAQVFLTRLENGMALGSDVTVSYALDTIDPDRNTYSDNEAALTVDSCYNTRIHRGLPCGPISNPSLSALLAVANPSDTSYLYFLTGDDGMMYYSYTESEHNQNIYSHCQKLCNVSL